MDIVVMVRDRHDYVTLSLVKNWLLRLPRGRVYMCIGTYLEGAFIYVGGDMNV